MVGNETNKLELVLYGRRVAAARRTGKRGDFGGVAGLFAFGDLVGDGYGIRCCKAHVAAQGIGAKGICLDERGGFVEAACGIISIELVFDGRLLLDVVGRDNPLVQLLLLFGELVARSRCVARGGPADRAAHEPHPGKRQRARRTRKSCSTREQSTAFVTQSHFVAAFECRRRFPHIPWRLPTLSNMTRSLTNTP